MAVSLGMPSGSLRSCNKLLAWETSPARSYATTIVWYSTGSISVPVSRSFSNSLAARSSFPAFTHMERTVE
uniref:Uncharacterized protein n=1 Tax=Arundo donax TaxID=35708 RepID=A0A0A9D4M2_ARUDO